MTDCAVFVLCNPKGGTGKTTNAHVLTFSEAFEKRFKKIALVELDPQANQLTWMQKRQAAGLADDRVVLETIYDQDLKVVGDKLKRLANHFDCLVLDLPGESEAKTVTKLGVAITRSMNGLMLIPLSDSAIDEDAFTNKFFPAIEPYLATERFWILPSKFRPNTKPENVQGYFSAIAPEGPAALRAFMPQLNVFGVYSASGETLREHVADLAGKDAKTAGKAVSAAENVADEILRHYF